MRKLTVYPWHTGKLSRPLRLMVVCDLHNRPYEDILPMLDGADALLVPGDVADRYHQRYDRGVDFLREASSRLPTLMGIGNHEARLRDFDAFCAAVRATRATLLMNGYARVGELLVGCWYRPEAFGQPDMLPAMEAENGCKVLLCHRPEDYMRNLRGTSVDLVLAGHAHGGQIRIANRGLYAPGQGIFLKFTRGIVDQKMIVSAGAANAVPVPRWGNPCEVLRIDLD